MTNGELWLTVKEYTHEASQVARHLGFAAGGLHWAAKDPTLGWSEFSKIGLILVVGFFVCDLFQYVFAAVRRQKWIRAEEIRMHEETGGIEGEYQVPVSLDSPVHAIWWMKLVLLACSFLFVALELLL